MTKARYRDTDMFSVSATNPQYNASFFRGAGSRGELIINNLGSGLGSYTVFDVLKFKWLYERDTLLMAPAYFYAMKEATGTVFANTGSVGGNGTITAGTISAAIPSPPEVNAPIHSLNNGIVRVATAGICAPFQTNCLEMWVFVTSVGAGGGFLYSETNAANTHFFQPYLDGATRKMAFRASNGTTTVNVVSSAATAVPLNTWTHLQWLTGPTGVTFYQDSTLLSSVAFAAMPTFSDANLVSFGNVLSIPNLMSAVAIAPNSNVLVSDLNLTARRHFEMMNGESDAAIASGSLAAFPGAGSTALLVMGEGSNMIFPDQLSVAIGYGSGQVFGTVGFANIA
jgi:hypothetical protein